MTQFLLLLHIALFLALAARVLLRNDLAPDVRMAWLMIGLLLPYVGAVLYFLLGEADLSRGAAGRHLKLADFVRQRLAGDAAAQRALGSPAEIDALIAPRWQGVSRYAASINGFQPVAGNRAELMSDGDSARARLLADLDAAQHEINVLYYIWLGDHTGTEVAQALMRAARRGVACRALVDGLGSRALTRSPLWREMAAAGVRIGVALPIDHPLKVMLTSRIDLRNHRKITLIDGRITYVGSQNCADAAFRIKAKYAPWVDIMLRVEGSVVAQAQLLFACDWMQIAGDADFAPVARARPAAWRICRADGGRRTHRAPPLHAAAVRHADRQGAHAADHLHPLLRARRHRAGGAVRRRLARRAGDAGPAAPQRFMDRRRRQPQHLRPAAHGRRRHPRIPPRPAARQDADG